MAILIDRNTRLLVQGITGRDGAFHTKQMVAYGTKVVAGVTPGKAGEKVEGVPVFNTVREAVAKTKANAAVVYVPPMFAADAILEAAAHLPLVICITEGIPTVDMLRVARQLEILKAEGRPVRLVGPNCPGLLSPGQSKVGILPGHIAMPGPVGVVSRSGTLTYEVVYGLTRIGIGQTTCLGIGGDPVIGTRFVDALALFQKDPKTKAIVMVGEIGGTDEEAAAAFVKKHVTKPVVGFIAGASAPPGKRMGHAGAIISGGSGTAQEKIAALQAAGIVVAESPADLGVSVQRALSGEW